MSYGAIKNILRQGLDLEPLTPTTSPDPQQQLTSNRDVEEWYPLFGDPLLASAAMDRLLHNAHIVVMSGDTYRNPPRPSGLGAVRMVGLRQLAERA